MGTCPKPHDITYTTQIHDDRAYIMLLMVGGQGHGRIGMTHGPCDWLFCQHNHSLAHEPVCGTQARCTPTTPTSIQHIGALLRSSHARPEPHRASRFGTMSIIVHLGHVPYPPNALIVVMTHTPY
jgi:hypothetical protein